MYHMMLAFQHELPPVFLLLEPVDLRFMTSSAGTTALLMCSQLPMLCKPQSCKVCLSRVAVCAFQRHTQMSH